MPQVLWDDPQFANLKCMVNAFGLRATSDPMHWQLTLADENITPGGALQGGIGMGIAVDALESVTGRQAIWSTAQYLSYAEPPGEIDIKLSLDVVGHRITQARATLHLGKTEVLTTLVALGSRDFEVEGTPVQKPPPNQRSNVVRRKWRVMTWRRCSTR